MKIGIMGGTFNPIHNGHLFIGEEAIGKFGLDEIWFIPVGKPPHKVDNEILESKFRYDMVQLAIEDNKRFKISDLEINRKGYTYAVDTLKELQTLNADLYYIIGADTLLTLHKWKAFSEIAQMCQFIAISRPGFNEAEVLKAQLKLASKFGAQIQLCQIEGLNISSTMIRQRIQKDESVKYLTPDKVVDYLQIHQLYKTKQPF